MKHILLASVLLLAACDEGRQEIKIQSPKPWEEATTTHHCTDEQQRRVESDTLFCKENTSYFSSYCFGSAIMRNCSPKVNK